MGQPYIKGYKPLFGYQGLLEEEVAVYLDNHKSFFKKAFKKFADDKSVKEPVKINFNKLIDAKSPPKTSVAEKDPSFQPIKTNFLVREQNNQLLGEKGEQLVFDYERWRLTKADKPSLVDKVEWVAKSKGDGMDFDILSKTIGGKDMFIEVKTTKLAKETPFYFSRNEWKFAQIKGSDFYLYRAFNFSDSPQIFIKKGDYESFCRVKAQSFRVFLVRYNPAQTFPNRKPRFQPIIYCS